MSQATLTPVPAGTSRRRAEMLQRSAAIPVPVQVVPLGLADVQSLQADPSPENRALIARKLGQGYGSLARQGDQRLANAVLQLLMRDIAVAVRAALAEAVAAAPELPRAVAGQLAQDDLEVARPILERSPVLTDEDLTRIVRTNAMQYALAVAGRERISESVAHALVETGQEAVVVRLVANLGARLSTETMGRVVADFGSSSEVQDRLVRRPELPYELVEQLVGLIGDKLEWDLVRQRSLSSDHAKWLAKDVRERSAINLTARAHGDQRNAAYWRHRAMEGGLAHEDLLALLRDGDVAGFEEALAAKADLPASRVRRLLYDADRRHLAALCLKADFPTAHYVMVRTAIDMAEEALSENQGRTAWSSEAVRFMQDQYERLRRDSERQGRLLQQ